MNRIRQDDPTDFTEVYAQHARAIHRYLARRLGTENADELTSDTFVAAWNKWSSYDPDRGSITAWLYGIATNLMRRHRRREDAELRALARSMAPEDLIDPSEALAAGLDARNRLARVATAISELKHDDRDVVLLIAWAELSYDEVASALDIPVGTVRSRLHRARRQLRLSELSHLEIAE